MSHDIRIPINQPVLTMQCQWWDLNFVKPWRFFLVFLNRPEKTSTSHHPPIQSPSAPVCVCVCVCVELLKRSKTCISITLAIFWQYMNLFRGAALTSGLSHVHLFIFLVLAEKALSILQYNLSRGARPPVMTLPNKASHWRGSRV